MQLHVALYRDGAKIALSREVVSNSDDVETLGAYVGRQVRDWLRCRPIAKTGTRARFDVHAWWTTNDKPAVVERAATTDETAPQPSRRKRAK